MAKKVEKDLSVDVSSVTNVENVELKGDVCVDMPVVGVDNRKSSSKKSKKVADVALEVQISDLEDALSKAKDAIESASAENERLCDELGVAVNENKQLRKELAKCKQDFKRVQADNRANSALVDTLNGELTRFKVRTNELTDTISRLQGKIGEYSKELSLKDVELIEARADLTTLQELNFWGRLELVFVGWKYFKKKS